MINFLKLFVFIIFLIFSALQLNDPDKYIWFLLYLSSAFMFFIKRPFLNYYIPILLSICSILFVVSINKILLNFNNYEPYYELGGIILIISAVFLTIKESLNEKR